jgi:hypothetical protein
VTRRFAFAAQYWDDFAVVCRAVENCPGPVVEPQFGLFDTWTAANAFADSLNQGLDISAAEAREILSACLLRRDSLVHSLIPSSRIQKHSRVHSRNLEARRNFVRTQLKTACILCESVSLIPKKRPRLLCDAAKTLHNANRFILMFDGDHADLIEIVQMADQLNEALRKFGDPAEFAPRRSAPALEIAFSRAGSPRFTPEPEIR